MCGRFSLYTPPARVARFFQATLGDDVDPERPPSWNVAPTTDVLGVRVRHSDGERVLTGFRWGLVPSWATDPTVSNRMFNARSETVTTKPAFRKAFASRRLVIPADGFYEWQKGPGKRRTAYYFSRADGDPLGFAGLFEAWRDPEVGGEVPGGGGDGSGASGGGSGGNPWLLSCTIITTGAGQDMGEVHDRMPVILGGGQVECWLDPGSDPDELVGLLVPSPSGTLVRHVTDGRVGKVQNDDAGLIEAAPGDEPGMALRAPAEGAAGKEAQVAFPLELPFPPPQS